ncbi:N-6 DNA methylase, partial [Klebsiella pneumoniae]
TVCVVGKMRDLILQLSKSSIYSTKPKYAYLASLKEIQDNDYNLNIPRYVDTFEEEDEIDLLAVRAEREQLKAELAKLETEMAGYLKELGYGS